MTPKQYEEVLEDNPHLQALDDELVEVRLKKREVTMELEAREDTIIKLLLAQVQGRLSRRTISQHSSKIYVDTIMKQRHSTTKE